jgi:hypothetical protein
MNQPINRRSCRTQTSNQIKSRNQVNVGSSTAGTCWFLRPFHDAIRMQDTAAFGVWRSINSHFCDILILVIGEKFRILHLGRFSWTQCLLEFFSRRIRCCTQRSEGSDTHSLVFQRQMIDLLYMRLGCVLCHETAHKQWREGGEETAWTQKSRGFCRDKGGGRSIDPKLTQNRPGLFWAEIDPGFFWVYFF